PSVDELPAPQPATVRTRAPTPAIPVTIRIETLSKIDVLRGLPVHGERGGRECVPPRARSDHRRAFRVYPPVSHYKSQEWKRAGRGGEFSGRCSRAKGSRAPFPSFSLGLLRFCGARIRLPG